VSALETPDATVGPARGPEAGNAGYWMGVWRRVGRDPITLVSTLLLLAILLAILSAPLLAPYDPYLGSISRRLQPIGAPGHLLGTDELGRDMLTRLLYGGRMSCLLGITPVALAFLIGGFFGIIAGFAGGWLNTLVMRVTDVFYAFPSVLLAVAISGALGPGVANAILSLTLVFIPPIIRVAEGATVSVRNLDYVESARASGAGAVSIVSVHVLPNVLGHVFVYATSLVGVSMILAAGLSFLGLGSRPPEAEWGSMLNTLRMSIYSLPQIAILPGVCIFTTSACFNLVSDGLRRAMDIRA
jgi:peptide/nickel transport system permease protein